MNVLQLKGESAQLRQVAKLYMAGDISRDDYRNIRTTIIDAFVMEDFVILDDDPDISHPPVGAAASVFAAGAVAHAHVDAPTDPHISNGGWSLLAIVGAGAMLLIVAMLAMLLS